MSDEKSGSWHHFDRWGESWKNGRKQRYGLMWAARGLVGAPVAKVVGGVAAVAAVALRYPQAVATAVRATVRDNRIGPNLKVATVAATPALVGLASGVVCVGAAFVGIGRGFWQGPVHGPIAALSDAYHGFCAAGEVLSEWWDDEPTPLKEGEKPFDIRPITAAWSVVVGGVSSVLMGFAQAATYLRHLPRLVHRIYAFLWGGKTGIVAFFLDVASITVVPLSLVLLLPASAVVGALCGFWRGMETTYRKGTRAVVEGHRRDLESASKVWRRWARDVEEESPARVVRDLVPDEP